VEHVEQSQVLKIALTATNATKACTSECEVGSPPGLPIDLLENHILKRTIRREVACDNPARGVNRRQVGRVNRKFFGTTLLFRGSQRAVLAIRGSGLRCSTSTKSPEAM
jgi:hypothetical protein